MDGDASWLAGNSEARTPRAAAHAGHIIAKALSPHGSRSVTAEQDRSIRFLDPATDRELAIMLLDQPATNLQFTPDGTRLIILLADGSAEVWDTRPAEARQADRDVRWAERIPARAYVDELLAGPTPRDQLEAAIREDKSITPLRRLVALKALRDQLEEMDAQAQSGSSTNSSPLSQPVGE